VKRPGVLLTVAIAWVGVVLGHLAAYLLAYPTQGARHLHLALTGHTWTGLATASLLAVIPVILLTFVLRSIRAPGSWSGSDLALRLAVIQAPAFLAIEIVERDGSLGQAFSDPAVFVGLILQPLVAVLASWVLELVRRSVRAIVARFLTPRPVATRAFPRPGLLLSLPRTWAFLPARLRAPPLPANP
jgi:hypothetical protein